MACLRKRGKMHYSRIQINGKSIVKALSTDKNLALVKLGQLIQLSSAKKTNEIPTDSPFSIFFENDQKDRKILGLEKNSLRTDKGAVNRVNQHCPIETIQDITPDMLNQYAIKRLDKCNCDIKHPKIIKICPRCRKRSSETSYATVYNDIKRMKSLVGRAQLQGLVQPQNWKLLKKIPNPSRIDFYTPDELGKILDVCDLLYTKIVVLGFRTGLRRGEILILEWKFINYETNAIIMPQPKVHDRPKTIPMWPDLREHLIKWQKKSKSKFVIGSGQNGNADWRPHENSISHQFGRLLKKAGVNHGCLHVLRHSYATHLVSQGVHIENVKEYMGHKSIATTMKYNQYKPAWNPKQANGSHYQLPYVPGLS